MCVFRENTEDIYAGIEWEAGTPEAEKFYRFLHEEMGVAKVRFPETSSFGVKPVSKEGTERLVRAACSMRSKTTFLRYAGTQGEHHEVHRRRFQEMGI